MDRELSEAIPSFKQEIRDILKKRLENYNPEESKNKKVKDMFDFLME